MKQVLLTMAVLFLSSGFLVSFSFAQEAPRPVVAAADAQGDAAPAPRPRVPALPAPPANLEREVARLRGVAARTRACFGEAAADRRCATWFAQLSRSRVAAAYAIGGYLAAPTDAERAAQAASPGAGASAERLAMILASTQVTEAVPFALAYLAREGNPEGATVAMHEALASLTGHDVVARPVWEGRAAGLATPADRRAALDAWLRWYAAHGAEARPAWLASGRARAIANLASPDAATRFAAIRRLAGSPGDADAVRASLAELLGRADLAEPVRGFLARFARRNGLAATRAQGA